MTFRTITIPLYALSDECLARLSQVATDVESEIAQGNLTGTPGETDSWANPVRAEITHRATARFTVTDGEIVQLSPDTSH